MSYPQTFFSIYNAFVILHVKKEMVRNKTMLFLTLKFSM